MKKELEYKESLTNEQLLKRFKNQFELVRYAIQLAENAIRSGREMDHSLDSQNVSYQVLSEIAAHQERFEPIPESRMEESQVMTDRKSTEKKSQEGSFLKAAKEMKKERKSKMRTVS